jgi:hypothetical protein
MGAGKTTAMGEASDLGLESFLIAAAIESRDVLNHLTRAMGNANATTCRLANAGHDVTAVALEMLVRARWIDS